MGESSEKEGKRSRSKKAVAFSVIGAVLCVVFLALLCFQLWLNSNFYVVTVQGSSMQNTLFDGDNIYASYDTEIERGDIVIINVKPYQSRDGFHEDYIIKRIIAVEGDMVHYSDGVLSIRYAGDDHFTVLEESYIIGENHYTFEKMLGENEIFFMGDNRDVSKDSSHPDVGSYHTTDIVGVVPQWVVSHRKLVSGWAFLGTIFRSGDPFENT